jgi:hypothetical protein
MPPIHRLCPRGRERSIWPRPRGADSGKSASLTPKPLLGEGQLTTQCRVAPLVLAALSLANCS